MDADHGAACSGNPLDASHDRDRTAGLKYLSAAEQDAMVTGQPRMRCRPLVWLEERR